MLPNAFLERMERMLGEEYDAFLRTFEEDRYQALRLNVLKQNMEGKSPAEVYGVPEGEGTKATCFGHLSAVPWAENGYYYEPADRPGKHPCHEAGLYYIQEPSAMAPAELLSVRPGDRVLDLCAAPGGKSTQLAAHLRGEGFLLCNEVHPARAKILSENIERMGVCNACVTNETPMRLAEKFPGYFDRILVDAPCSGEGMFRKSEAACLEWSPENVRMCADRQDEILDRAAEMLRPGGRLVYSTCTFEPEENEGSISRFLARHGDFHIVSAQGKLPGLDGYGGMVGAAPGGGVEPGCGGTSGAAPGGGVEPGCGGMTGAELRCGGITGDVTERVLRLWPHRVRGEGHFAAVLEKGDGVPEGRRGDMACGGVPEGRCGDMACGGLPERRRDSVACGGEKEVSRAELGEYRSFCGDNLRGESLRRQPGEQNGQEILEAMVHSSRYVRFGDQLYLVPEAMPGMKGLKVLRPGLHLGELKKNRFEPSHALALALSPRSAVHVWNLRSDDPTALAYFQGRTFPAEGEKGWYLICIDGFSAGWGKLAGGVMKNHYPKGLRR